MLSTSFLQIERQPVATQLDDDDRRREDDDQRDTIYRFTPMPGYEGYIPRTKDKFGKRYAVTTTEGLSEFERDCQRTRAQLKRLRHRVAQPISTISKGSLGERMVSESGCWFLPLFLFTIGT